jgi:hypothetical protein
MCSYLKPFQAFAEEDSRKTRDKRFKDKIPDLPSVSIHMWLCAHQRGKARVDTAR